MNDKLVMSAVAVLFAAGTGVFGASYAFNAAITASPIEAHTATVVEVSETFTSDVDGADKVSATVVLAGVDGDPGGQVILPAGTGLGTDVDVYFDRATWGVIDASEVSYPSIIVVGVAGGAAGLVLLALGVLVGTQLRSPRLSRSSVTV